ncbi:hypothetical protein JR316_0001432 [Psilocybe cubensis]|uniref:Uncharacterized protein n=2 Tax=Psilocybe cubensis TaxID=181762 RepID=A0A8H7YBB2_PSICU|nr:hypothetical protein JR316_0001432 [Psilocybe cubensis]KAH9487358.1 hypothetical protein JR316_0001432 [Psilocybe cubensis]
MSSVGNTIVGGIQDISALLPLLGTEQCEEHVGSALYRGFLYVCISPISIFGSLGIAKAGFNVVLASFNIQRLEFLGAKKLDDGGFTPKGAVAPMIGLDPLHQNRFLAESRLEVMLRDENIENVEDLTVSWDKGNPLWNLKLILFTFLGAPLGLTPYLYIILRSGNTTGDPLFLAGWGFPIIRIVGSCLCVIVVQILIQIRILVIIRMRLLFISMDRIIKEENINLEAKPYNLSWNSHTTSETCLWALERWLAQQDGGDERNELRGRLRVRYEHEHRRQFPPNSRLRRFIEPWMNFFLHWLLAGGIFLAILGYIGCFNLVSNAPSNSHGPLIWLGMEVFLSVLRIVVWAFNPSWDDSKGITFNLKLAAHSPLITCSKSFSDIEEDGEAPVMRANSFLEEIVAYTGPLPSFSWPDVALYYILTSRDDPSNVQDDEPAHGILYVVILDYKEQTSRILTKSPGTDSYFDIFISSLEPDPGSTVINVKFVTTDDGRRVVTPPKSHSLTADARFMEELTRHYNKIISQIRNRRDPVEFPKAWDMLRSDEESSSQDDADDWPGSGMPVKGHDQSDDDEKSSNNSGSRRTTLNFFDTKRFDLLLTKEDVAYLRQGQLERRCKIFFGALEEWIELFVVAHVEALLKAVPTNIVFKEGESVTVVQKYEANEVEYLLIECRAHMERLAQTTFNKWISFLETSHQTMVKAVLDGTFPSNSGVQYGLSSSSEENGSLQSNDNRSEEGLKYEKLRSRLVNEWQRLLEVSETSRAENMRKRLDLQRDTTKQRIQARKYHDQEGETIIAVWKARLHLLEADSPEQNQNAGIEENDGTDSSPAAPESAVHSPDGDAHDEAPDTQFIAKMVERFNKGQQEVGQIPDNAQKNFKKNMISRYDRMKERCRSRATEMLSRMEVERQAIKQMSVTDFLTDDTSLWQERRVYWSRESLQQRLRLLRQNSHKFVEAPDMVTEDSLDVLE